MNQMLGKMLDGRYRIVRLLGKGGFGETYLAEDIRRIGRQCVVKRLQPASKNPDTLQEAKRLFDSEAITLDKLGKEHDQIPDLLDYFEENQEYYLVQELVEGRPLSAVILAGMTEAQLINIIQDVLGVLSFVHQSQVIHRDIKPSNLMQRQKDGRIVLIDFGAVKQIHTQYINAEGETTFSRVIGTPGYMPNEQGRGKPRFCSDIYALGMVAIEALTRISPNQLQEDPNTGEVIWRERSHVSPQLADIIDKMVRSHFRDRYQSANEVLDDLKNLPSPGGDSETCELQLQPSVVPVPTGLNTPKKFRLLVGLGTAAVVMMTSSVYFQRWQVGRDAQIALEKVKELKTQGKYQECMTLAAAFPQKYSDLYPTARSFLNDCRLGRDREILAQARGRAKTNNLEAAIQKIKEVAPDSPIYVETQNQTLSWKKMLLQNYLRVQMSEHNKALANIMSQIEPEVHLDANQITISYDNSSYRNASNKDKENFLRILTVVLMETFRGNGKEHVPPKYTEFKQLVVYPQQDKKKAVITTDQWDTHINSQESAKQLYPVIKVSSR